MAGKERLPWALEKRALLYERTDTDFAYWGDLFFSNERYADALEFYLAGKVVAGLEKMKGFSLEEGDYYILSKIAEKFPDMVSVDDWRELADTAMKKGKFAYAVWAYEKCGEESLMRLAAEKAGIELPKPKEGEQNEEKDKKKD
jgi:hypothetical protein